MSWNQLVRGYSPEVQALAEQTRRLIQGVLGDPEEHVRPEAKLAGYGYGAGYSNLVCTILFNKSGVKLGLFGGAALADPDRLLEGSGKVHRYVDIRTAADISRPGVKKLVAAARDARRKTIRREKRR